VDLSRPWDSLVDEGSDSKIKPEDKKMKLRTFRATLKVACGEVFMKDDLEA